MKTFEQQQRQQQLGQPAVGREQRQGATREPRVEIPGQPQSHQHVELRERPQRAERVGFLEREPQLGTEAASRDRVHRRGPDRLLGQLAGIRLDLESQPGAVAAQAEQAGGVVDERAVVEDPEPPPVEVGERVVGGHELARAASRQVDGDRVDGEVPAGQVLILGAGSDLREGPGDRVALCPAPGDVHPARRPHHGRGFEAVVEGQDRGAFAAQLEQRQQVPRETPGVGGHDHVQLLRGTAEEEVADRPSDQGDVLVALGERHHLLPPGSFVEPFEDDLRVGHTGMRTGTPASARVAFASATVKRR